ncbi:LLM class flavin-dependent oxidoreductase [Gordonia hankookensis]|nr:LLM class flavin-dependent oxidoreductase [Gordonia hankookensis]
MTTRRTTDTGSALMTTLGTHLAIALTGAGWHPLAWREPDACPDDLLTADYWTDLVGEADRAGIDLVTIADRFRLRPPTTDDLDRPAAELAAGRLDSVLVAARVASTTSRVGLVPTVVATHTEPFHAAKAIATLDYVGRARAGVLVEVADTDPDARLFGRRTLPAESAERQRELFSESTEYVEVLRHLWDSWEDGAEIRDVSTGRFVDRRKLHHIDFEGRFFSVRGPSITPRPPQGQPVIAATTAAGAAAVDFVGASADIGFVAAHDRPSATRAVAAVRDAQSRAGREDEQVHVLADLLVHLDDRDRTAEARRNRLDDVLGTPYTGGVPVFSGTAADLADHIADLTGSGITGVRLRPATVPHDLLQITTNLVPELRRRGLIRDADAPSLRERLGLTRPANRFTLTTATTTGAGRR